VAEGSTPELNLMCSHDWLSVCVASLFVFVFVFTFVNVHWGENQCVVVRTIYLGGVDMTTCNVP